jgi:hypothetical protein
MIAIRRKNEPGDYSNKNHTSYELHPMDPLYLQNPSSKASIDLTSPVHRVLLTLQAVMVAGPVAESAVL